MIKRIFSIILVLFLFLSPASFVSQDNIVFANNGFKEQIESMPSEIRDEFKLLLVEIVRHIIINDIPETKEQASAFIHGLKPFFDKHYILTEKKLDKEDIMLLVRNGKTHLYITVFYQLTNAKKYVVSFGYILEDVKNAYKKDSVPVRREQINKIII